MSPDARFVWLDFARGASALMVCASHLRAAMFVDHASLSSSTLGEKLFYLFTGFGHQAVMVFFVLSGFLVGGGVLERGTQFNFRDYLTARLVRLWIVLIPALFFTLLVDLWIERAAPGLFAGNYHVVLQSGPNEAAGYSASLGTLLANVGFLQTSYAPVYGSNGPLWSLANEFWYYILFPLMVITTSRQAGLLVRILTGVLVIMIVLMPAREMLLGFLVWLFGVVAFVLRRKLDRAFSRWWVLLAVILFSLALLDSKVNMMSRVAGLPSDVVVGASFAALLVVASGNSSCHGVFERIARGVSEVSYTLYLFHFPLVLLIFAGIYRRGQLTLGWGGFLEFVGFFALILLAGIAMWWLFERNTPAIRKVVSGLFGVGVGRKS